jgi:hypothetical protein
MTTALDAGGMTLDYPTGEQARGQPWGRWTPAVIRVLTAAKTIAGPAAKIEAEHLLLGFESAEPDLGDGIAWQALARVGIRPSAHLGRPAPEPCARNRYVPLSEFGPGVSRVFPALAIEEAVAMGDDYVGAEHLLLFLARANIPGVDLPYERIRKEVLECRGSYQAG